jgi:hypothetical protein
MYQVTDLLLYQFLEMQRKRRKPILLKPRKISKKTRGKRLRN